MKKQNSQNRENTTKDNGTRLASSSMRNLGHSDSRKGLTNQLQKDLASHFVLTRRQILIGSLVTICLISSQLWLLNNFVGMFLLWVVGGLVCLSQWRK